MSPAGVPAAALPGREVVEVALILDRTIAPADARLNADVRQRGSGSWRCASAPTMRASRWPSLAEYRTIQNVTLGRCAWR